MSQVSRNFSFVFFPLRQSIIEDIDLSKRTNKNEKRNPETKRILTTELFPLSRPKGVVRLSGDGDNNVTK